MRYDETPLLRQGRPPKPVTLPTVALAEISDDVIEEEARAAQARVIERRVVRAGRDAWEAIHKVQTFDGWAAISRVQAMEAVIKGDIAI